MTDQNTTQHTNPTHQPDSVDLGQLVEAYPYMFTETALERAVFSVWYEPFADLCRAIDAVLGEYKHGVHWVQLKEKFGQLRWHWEIQDELGMQGDLFLDLHLGERTNPADPRQRLSFRKEVPGELRARIRALVDAATDACAQRCQVCGEDALGHVIQGWVHILCLTHAADLQGGAEDNPVNS